MKMVELSSLGIFRNGLNYDKDSVKNGCKIIGVADFGNRIYPDYNSLAEVDANIVSTDDFLCAGDILFVRSNGNKNLVGRSMFIREITEPVCYSGFCICLRPKQSVVVPEYLFYVLRSPFCRKQYSYSQQTNITNLSQAVLGAVKVPIPSLEVQKSISKVLSDIDQKIQANTQINSELESMAKTIYDYWFTQFDFPNAEGKPYRSSGGKMVWNEQLNKEIPEGWEVLPVTQCYDVCYGFPFNTELFTEDSSAQPLVRIRDILENTISAYTTENVDERYWLHSGDMVIGMDGNFHINFWDSTSALLNQRCVRIRSTGEYPVLMAYFSAIPYIKSREKTVSRTTVGHLSADDIKALYILRPDDVTLSSVKMQFDVILKKLCQARDENRELKKLRDWLLPMLMNGQATIE